MYIHHEAKLVYLAQPRTASKSTAEALSSVGFVDNADRIFASASGLHHLTVRESELEFGDEWVLFCAVRNHWDTVVSWLCNLAGGLGYSDPEELDWSVKRIRESLDGNPWVEEKTLWHRHLPDATRVVRFESMEDDLGAILADAGLNMQTMPHVEEPTVSFRCGRPYQDFFTDETRAYVAERFADEIYTLGYSY